MDIDTAALRDQMDAAIRKMKDKGAPSAQERKAYRRAWREFVDREGLTDDARRYLTEGYVFLPGIDLLEYCDGREDGDTEMKNVCENMLHAHSYLDRKNAFGALLACLGHALADADRPDRAGYLASRAWCVHPVTDAEPTPVPAKKVESTIRYTLFMQIDTKTALPDVNALAMSTADAEGFRHMMQILLDRLNGMKLNGRERAALEKLQTWVDGINTPVEKGLSDTDHATSQSIQGLPKAENEQRIGTLCRHPTQPTEGRAVRSFTDAEQQRRIPDILRTIADAAQTILADVNRLRVDNAKLQSERDDAIRIKTVQEQEHKTALETLKAVNVSNTQKLRELHEELDRSEALIADLRQQVQEKIQLVDMIQRDTASTEMEQLNRLGRELSREYCDFADALNMDMTTVLGENLRDQLRNVFALIEEAGIPLEKRDAH